MCYALGNLIPCPNPNSLWQHIWSYSCSWYPFFWFITPVITFFLVQYRLHRFTKRFQRPNPCHPSLQGVHFCICTSTNIARTEATYYIGTRVPSCIWVLSVTVVFSHSQLRIWVTDCPQTLLQAWQQSASFTVLPALLPKFLETLEHIKSSRTLNGQCNVKYHVCLLVIFAHQKFAQRQSERRWLWCYYYTTSFNQVVLHKKKKKKTYSQMAPCSDAFLFRGPWFKKDPGAFGKVWPGEQLLAGKIVLPTI